jgi:hypothetical protein
MTTVVNPKCACLIKGIVDIWTDDFDKRIDIDIDVTKDLDKEPNEATVTLYNLNENTISQIIDPSVKDTPIEIFFSPFGTEDLVRCFVGEIKDSNTRRLFPGIETTLTCTSSRWQYRSRYIDKKTYAAGTSYTTIVNDFVAEIGLSNRVYGIPDDSIVLAQSFTGPAFVLLDRFVRDLGMFCHITDGVLYVTSIYEPVEPSVVHITEAIQETAPQAMERTDIGDVLLHTIVDTRGTGLVEVKRGKRRKRLWPKKVKDLNDDYTELEAVDTILTGVECQTLGVPGINPDNIVTFEGDDNQYRVHTVRHFGSNDSEGFSTVIQADIIEGVTGGGGTFEDDTKTPTELREGLSL